VLGPQLVYRLRWYASTTHIGTVTGRIYDQAAGTLFAGPVAFPSITPGAWNVSDYFVSPVSLADSKVWTIAVHNTGGGYAFTASAFNSAPITNGNLKAIQSGVPAFNNVFDYGAVTVPNDNGSGANFFVDVDIDPNPGGGADARQAAFMPFFMAG